VTIETNVNGPSRGAGFSRSASAVIECPSPLLVFGQTIRGFVSVGHLEFNQSGDFPHVRRRAAAPPFERNDGEDRATTAKTGYRAGSGTGSGSARQRRSAETR